MKDHLDFLLSQRPSLYTKVLRWRGSQNIEKMLYLDLIRQGDVVFDVGANVGYYTLLFSHLVGKLGVVHAFEPVPVTYAVLADSVGRRQRSDNIRLNNTAVGSTNGQTTLYLPGSDLGQASLVTHESGSWQGAATVTPYPCPIARLDDYAASASLGRLDFVKIDVEGAELLALQGFAETISRFQPILHLEVSSDWTKAFHYQPLDILELLLGLGYTRFGLVTDTIRVLKDPAEELSSDAFSGFANLLCIIPHLHAARSHSPELVPLFAVAEGAGAA